ncbi:hypothetical protein BDR07DRAFT_556154 [Suillus spraguei]|nr:hypothetical protein BDR07DRAFT_556154 [Suillus spraguei]
MHEEHCSQDITKDQSNKGSFSAKHEVDEGVTMDRMHQAVIESGCECQSSEVNEVSKTLESEHTWNHQSSEWHIQRQVLQHVHSSSAVILQVEESNLPSQGSSAVKLKDSKEEMAADCTCQVMEVTRNCKYDTTNGRGKESRVGADVAVLISSSPNSGLKGPPSEPSVPRDAATNTITVQSKHEYNFTEDSTTSVTSVHASSNRFTNSGNGYTCLDSSQQLNNPPGTMSILSMHDGSFLPPLPFTRYMTLGIVLACHV